MNAESEIHNRVGFRAVFGLAWPIVISMLSYTFMTIADTIFVGQLGTVPLAAIGIASVMTFLVTSFGAGLMKGVRVIVSQRVGAGREDEGRRAGVQGIWLALLVGVLAASLQPAGPLIFAVSGASGEVGELAQAYFGIRIVSAPVVFAFIGISAWFQGRGDTRTPTVAAVLANGLNVALDPLLIFGVGPVPGLGIAGAAWATVIAQVIGLVWLLRLGRRELSTTSWRPERRGIARVWFIGYPIGLRWFLDVAAFVVFASILAHVGTVDLAAHIIVVRIISVSFLPGHAIGEAAGVLVGQSVGANRPKQAIQAHRAGTWLALWLMVGFGAVFVLWPEPLVAVFGAEPEVAVVATDLLLVAAAFQLFDAVAMVSQSAINGTGDTRFVLVTGVLIGWGVKLPIGYALALPVGLGAVGAWIGLSFELLFLAVVSLWWIRRGHWLNRSSELQLSPQAGVS